MGVAFSECHESCEEECAREKKCYVDQNEVKICSYDTQSYPQGTKINRVGRQHSSIADLVAGAIPGASSRSTSRP